MELDQNHESIQDKKKHGHGDHFQYIDCDSEFQFANALVKHAHDKYANLKGIITKKYY